MDFINENNKDINSGQGRRLHLQWPLIINVIETPELVSHFPEQQSDLSTQLEQIPVHVAILIKEKNWVCIQETKLHSITQCITQARKDKTERKGKKHLIKACTLRLSTLSICKS